LPYFNMHVMNILNIVSAYINEKIIRVRYLLITIWTARSNTIDDTRYLSIICLYLTFSSISILLTNTPDCFNINKSIFVDILYHQSDFIHMSSHQKLLFAISFFISNHITKWIRCYRINQWTHNVFHIRLHIFFMSRYTMESQQFRQFTFDVRFDGLL